MRRQSKLDRFVYGFQHRWETDRQFRATMSGAIGLLVILSLCSFVGLATGFTNVALARFGGAPSTNVQSSNSQNTGTKAFDNPTSFPTNTVPPWVSQNAPAATPIGVSQTPAPTPDPSPTPTDTPTSPPCTSNCGGGGGGGGGGGTVTATWSPSTWVGGQSATINLQTSEPGDGLALIITFPGGLTVLDENGESSDGSGNYSYTFTVPSGIGAGTVDVYVQAHFSDGSTDTFHFNPPCSA